MKIQEADAKFDKHGRRIETPEEIMVVVSGAPMERSIAQAYAQLILWMEKSRTARRARGFHSRTRDTGDAHRSGDEGCEMTLAHKRRARKVPEVERFHLAGRKPCIFKSFIGRLDRKRS